MKRAVTEAELRDFVMNYPRPLKKDFYGVAEVWTYNDFTLGNWPDSIVAGYAAGRHNEPDFNWYLVE